MVQSYNYSGQTIATNSWEHLIQAVAQAPKELPTGPAILNFWAGRGGGKTTLLQMLRDKFGSNVMVTLLGSWDANASAPNRLAQEIFTAVEQSPEGRKKVVLLDNLDAFLHQENGTAFFDFERNVLLRLLEREDTLIIATSRTELRQWHEYDVRMRQRNYHIPTLAPDEVERLAQQWNFPQKRAFALTLGYPQMLGWLRELPNLSEEEIAQRAETYFFEGLSPDAKEFAGAVCLFPVFDIAVARLALSKESNETERSYADYLDLVRELIGLGLVFWDVEVGAYRFCESAVRRLCARSVRYRSPDEFYRIHRVAADHYKSEARRAAFLHHNLVSAIYHTAYANSQDRSAKVGEQCVEWVRDKRQSWLGADWDAVARAWRTGAGESAVVKELVGLIGDQVYSQITQLIEQPRQDVEV